MGALVSFILTGSPNNNPLNKTINPNWNMYDSKKPQGMTFNITASGIADPKFEAVNSGVLDRCNQLEWTPSDRNLQRESQ
ncbi:hypothetical protein FRC10_001167 [Ceratobasidium sp. 414]|nr:hypothetical protein FRC10_001167 [Ceratobasidium sp. 414]